MREYTLTVTSKGQVTLPSDYRKATGIETGSTLRLLVDDTGEGHIRRRLTLDEIAGSMTSKLSRKQRNFTQADIDASIGEAMDEQEDRVKKARS